MMSAFERTQVSQDKQPAPTYSDPQFLYTKSAGIVMPLLQAFIPGTLLAFAVLILSVVFGWRGAWKAALAIFGVMPFFIWVFLQWRWLVLTAEKVFQHDFDGGGIGTSPANAKAEPRLVKVQVNHVREGGHLQVDLINLPCTESQLEKLAGGLLNGVPFTEGAWCGSGKPFSVAEFRLLRTVMLNRGLITPRSEKDQRQGYELTEDGKAVMESTLRNIYTTKGE